MKTDENKGKNYVIILEIKANIIISVIILEIKTNNLSLSCLLKKLNVYRDVHVTVVSIGDMILIGFHDIQYVKLYRTDYMCRYC